MKRALPTLMLVLLLVACGNQIDSGVKVLSTSEEVIGGKYNLVLQVEEIKGPEGVFYQKKIQYEKDGEIIEPDQVLPDDMRSSLDWIRDNTPEDAIVMSWWDYGHAIRAYAEREPVADAPSKEILATTVSKYIGKDPSEIECDDCISHGIILDIAALLTAPDDSTVNMILDDYGATVLYIHREDAYKSGVFWMLVNDKRSITAPIVQKALDGEQIQGLTLAYRDDTAIVYERFIS